MECYSLIVFEKYILSIVFRWQGGCTYFDRKCVGHVQSHRKGQYQDSKSWPHWWRGIWWESQQQRWTGASQLLPSDLDCPGWHLMPSTGACTHEKSNAKDHGRSQGDIYKEMFLRSWVVGWCVPYSFSSTSHISQFNWPWRLTGRNEPLGDADTEEMQIAILSMMDLRSPAREERKSTASLFHLII